jgi:hypothetical protein
VDEFTAAHRDRVRRGETHPVWDFLFTYYNLRPRHLRVWHPGYGTALDGPPAQPYLRRCGYVATADGVTVGIAHLRARMETVRFVAGLLGATAARPPVFGCFGMHEWAMVYRTDAVRHGGVPLRLGARGTDTVVESMPLRCSHFDAHRFFTPAATARNEIQPTRSTQRDWEQPGCLHANMDIYKWCAKLVPLVDSDLLMDCLEVAADARELDDLVNARFEFFARLRIALQPVVAKGVYRVVTVEQQFQVSLVQAGHAARDRPQWAGACVYLLEALQHHVVGPVLAAEVLAREVERVLQPV